MAAVRSVWCLSFSFSSSSPFGVDPMRAFGQGRVPVSIASPAAEGGGEGGQQAAAGGGCEGTDETIEVGFVHRETPQE